MSPVLPADPAREHCLSLMAELDSSALGKELSKPGCGRMFGVLTCTDGTVLKAYSGDPSSLFDCLDFVPPAYDVKTYRSTLERYDSLIHSSTDHRTLSRQCWEELRHLYRFHGFDGLVHSLDSVFPDAPSGTGDCCAPRLLSHAYASGKKPASLCEFFYGSGSFEHRSFQGPCDARCKPLLPSIIGLDIVYLDSDIVVVNKSAGMLSIEGKGADKQDCIASRVRTFFPSCIDQPCIHRLDQATSGLMVLGLTDLAHDRLSRDFEERKVHKEYEALVDGLILKEQGRIELPMRLDVDNRPVQIVDFENGKKAVTEWKRLSIENRYGRKVTRLNLVPLTGRTHQLRVHCASGLNCPILGDTLYGKLEPSVPRMMLQARILEFTHPVTSKHLRFELPAEF